MMHSRRVITSAALSANVKYICLGLITAVSLEQLPRLNTIVVPDDE